METHCQHWRFLEKLQIFFQCEQQRDRNLTLGWWWSNKKTDDVCHCFFFVLSLSEKETCLLKFWRTMIAGIPKIETLLSEFYSSLFRRECQRVSSFWGVQEDKKSSTHNHHHHPSSIIIHHHLRIFWGFWNYPSIIHPSSHDPSVARKENLQLTKLAEVRATSDWINGIFQ